MYYLVLLTYNCVIKKGFKTFIIEAQLEKKVLKIVFLTLWWSDLECVKIEFIAASFTTEKLQ